jgi:hypothetical protein
LDANGATLVLVLNWNGDLDGFSMAIQWQTTSYRSVRYASIRCNGTTESSQVPQIPHSIPHRPATPIDPQDPAIPTNPATCTTAGSMPCCLTLSGVDTVPYSTAQRTHTSCVSALWFFAGRLLIPASCTSKVNMASLRKGKVNAAVNEGRRLLC